MSKIIDRYFKLRSELKSREFYLTEISSFTMHDIKVQKEFTFSTAENIAINYCDEQFAGVSYEAYKVSGNKQILVEKGKFGIDGDINTVYRMAGKNEDIIIKVMTQDLPDISIESKTKKIEYIGKNYTVSANKRAGTSEIKWEPGFGEYYTIAYEDRWPNEGDFDTNDVVVGYNFESSKNSGNIEPEFGR